MRLNRICGLLLTLAFLSLPGCSTPSPSPTPSPVPTETADAPAATPTPEVTPESPGDSQLILTFFPESVFYMTDGKHYSDLDYGNLLSVEAALPAGDGLFFVVLKKESVFPAVGFVTYYAAMVNPAENALASALLTVPEKERDFHGSAPLPEFEGAVVPVLQNGAASLLVHISETAPGGRENHQAGLWTLRDNGWSQRWPDSPYGSAEYLAYWKNRKAEIDETAVTLYTRPETPDWSSSGESDAPPDAWVLENTLALNELLA